VSRDEWKKTGVGCQVLIGMRDSGCRISRDHVFLLGFMFWISSFEFRILMRAPNGGFVSGKCTCFNFAC
jgi:hypothetical protein